MTASDFSPHTPGFPRVPEMVFSHRRELLNGLAVSGTARAGYALAISGYLEYCRHNGVSVSLPSARGYVSDAERRGLAPWGG